MTRTLAIALACALPCLGGAPACGDDDDGDAGGSTSAGEGDSSTSTSGATTASTSGSASATTTSSTGGTSEGGSTDAGTSSEGASDTSPADGSTDTGAGGSCQPDPGDDPCVACIKEPCCEGYSACENDEVCACTLDCVLAGSSLGSCKNRCNGDSELYEMLFFCGQMFCLNTCEWDCC